MGLLDLAQLKQDIIASIDISTFYIEYLEGCSPKKFDHSGWSNKLLCPLHKDTKTPNFSFNINSGGFICFACGAKGSIFDFWLYKNGYDPKDKSKIVKSVAALASDAGIDIEQWKKTDGKAYKDKIDPKKIKKIEESINSIKKFNSEEANDSSVKPINEDIVDGFIDNIRPEHVEFLVKQRGLKAATIKEYKLGFDDTWIYKPDPKIDTSRWCFGRITIPVFNIKGEIRNIRGYSGRAEKSNKIMNFILNKGEPNEIRFGHPPRLFNADRLVKSDCENVVICEGEFDCILLNQELIAHGLDNWIAVTGTHGVNSFEIHWIEYFRDRNVFICFDCDEEGVMASSSIATNFFLNGIKAGIFKSVKIIKLPLEGTKDMNDITDFFMKANLTITDFIELCDSAKKLIPGGINDDEASIEPMKVGNFVDAIYDRKYIDQRIEVPISISGATSRIYHAIRSYEINKCPLIGKESGCCHENVGPKEIPYGHPLFIKCCMSNEDANLVAIAKKVCTKRQKCDVTPVQKVVMHEFYAHQVIRRWRAEEVDGHLQNTQELVTLPVYILQPPGGLEVKPIDYLATGWIRTHPNTSIVTMFIERLEPLEDEWSSFNSEQKSNIDILRELKENFPVEKIIDQLTNHVTRIYEADEILYTVLLTYLSVMEFYFNDELIKGWINSAVIGDSGTGKSATYIKVSDWIGIGDIFSALSGSRTGLLYAIRRKNDEWHINVGAYVRSSGRIIAIDETQEIPSEEIKKMAIAMETGFLKIERVASGGYQTRTRTIFLLNPKRFNGQAATISEFSYGAECLQYCFDPMFIRRLDIAVFTTGNENPEFYNKTNTPKGNLELTPKMFKSLIFWAWTRNKENIKWDDSAVKLCLSETIRLSRKFGYVDLIPLVNPQDFRSNLARLSTAFAVLSCSFSDDFQDLLVKEEHVLHMSAFVDLVYSSSSCDLNQMSDNFKIKNTLSDSYTIIKKFFENRILADKNSSNPKIRKRFPFIQLIVTLEKVEYINRREICEQLGVNSHWLSEKITSMMAYSLVEQARYGYKRTRKFNLFLKQWRKEPMISDMLDGVFEKIASSISYSEMNASEFDEDSQLELQQSSPFD